jgi:hypothetical protein
MHITGLSLCNASSISKFYLADAYIPVYAGVYAGGVAVGGLMTFSFKRQIL